VTAEAIRRILVVDDDDSIRAVCLQILSMEGYSVEAAVNGMDALDKLKTSAYDLIISDINMPVLDGISLYLRVERDYPYLKNRFIFMTGGIVAGKEAKEVLSRISNRVVQKPFQPKTLLNQVKSLTNIPLEKYLNQIGLKRRKEERFALISDCEISAEEFNASSPLIAQMQDISESGIKVKHSGVPLLNKGGKVSVHIKNINIRRNARIVWTRDLSGFSLSGLRFMGPLPVSPVITY